MFDLEMNLTTFVNLKEVKDRLRDAFPKPRFSRKAEIKAEPQSTKYGLIGTAFDYLLRFYVEAHNESSRIISTPWVAEYSVPLLKRSKKKDMLAKTEKTLEDARTCYSEYLDNKEISEGLIETSINLAKLDLIYRISYIEPLGKPDPRDVHDLTNLMNAIPADMFMVNDIGVLNPTFGEGSHIVGGADCDLFLDGNLIDIKTSKYLKFDRDYFNQLVGYYLLSQYGGVYGVESPDIIELSIYFSRYGVIGSYPIEIINEAPKYQETYDWFIEKAKSIDPMI